MKLHIIFFPDAAVVIKLVDYDCAESGSYCRAIHKLKIFFGQGPKS